MRNRTLYSNYFRESNRKFTLVALSFRMRVVSLLCLFLLACCVGCGQSGSRAGYSVGGSIAFPDGTPVNYGEVTLTSRSFTGSGSIMGGSYGISGRVPAGTYRVSVQLAETPDTAGSATQQRLIDPKFNNPETSGLTVEVRERTTFNITVTAPQ